jgi:hypothetical protein
MRDNARMQDFMQESAHREALRRESLLHVFIKQVTLFPLQF